MSIQKDKHYLKKSNVISKNTLIILSVLINLILSVIVFIFFTSEYRTNNSVKNLKKEDFLPSHLLKWLDENPVVTLAHCRGYKPIDFWGHHDKWNGFSADYINQAFEILGLTFKDATGGSLLEKLDKVKTRDLDIVTSVYEQHLYDGVSYSKPYFKLPLMVFTRSEDKDTINSLNDLSGKVLGISKSSNVHPFFKQNYPNITLKECESHGKAYLQLSNGSIDACLSTLPSAVNKGIKSGVTNVVLASNAYIDLPYGFAMRDDWPELTEIINLTIAELDNGLRRQLYEKWFDNAGESRIITKDLIIVFLAISGFLVAILLMLRKKKELDERDCERERRTNESKSRFFTSISRDLQSPLAAMVGTLHLAEEGVDEIQRKKYVACALQSSDTLLKLLNEILHFSKVETGEITLYPAPHDLQTLLMSSIKLFQHSEKKGVSFEVDIDERDSFPKTVMIDELRLHQVVSNLVNNALKFTDRGVVQFKVKWLKTPHAYSCWHVKDYPELRENNGFLMIDVVDSGSGIDKKVLEKLFSPHPQEGDGEVSKVGLGLSTCHDLTLLMGGKMKASSELGSGSVFSILLPLQYAKNFNETIESPDTFLPHDSSNYSTKKCRVLVVDDDRLGNMFITNLCKSLQCDVDSTTEGQKALSFIKSHTYDIVFLDIEMPVMNGIEAIQQIRSHESLSNSESLTIVALTGHAGREDELKGYGFNLVITKPFDKEDVKRLIKEASTTSM